MAEKVYEIPPDFKVGDLFRLATNLTDDFGTEAEVTFSGKNITITPKERTIERV